MFDLSQLNDVEGLPCQGLRHLPERDFGGAAA